MGTEDKHRQSPNLGQVLASVLAAAFGVQSSQNRERDFQQGSPVVFIGIGLLATGLFILLIYSIVKLVIA